MAASNTKAMHEALEAIKCINTEGLKRLLVELVEADIFDGGLINKTISAVEKARRALSAPEMETEAINAAAMHEALELVNKIYDMLSKPCIVIEEVRQACQKARAVLISTPPRNCDVGTAKEQWKRFDEFCISWEESGPNGGCSDECPCMAIKSKESDGCFGQSGCFSIWAQMPYEEEGRAEK